MKPIKALLVCAALASISLTAACVTVPTTRFEWGDYESSLYAFAKHPEQRAAYQASLERTIERGRKMDRVAPGLLAELGYLHLEDGDNAQAVTLFEEEIRRFPEARPFLSDIIARAKGVSAKGAGA